MMHHPILLRLGLCLCLCLGFLATAAAQDYEAAGRHFAAAQDAFSKGQYRQAAEAFQAAHVITKDPVLLFNIGESYQRAGDAARATASYQAYLAAQPQAADRPEVEKRLQALEGAASAPAPAPGAPAAAETKKAPEAPKEERRQVAAASPLRTAAWATMAGAMAIVTAGAIVGLGAQNRADELSRRTTLVMGGQPLEYNAAERDAYSSLMSEGQSYNQAAIACLAIAGAAAVTSAVLFVVDWRRRPRPEAKQALRTPARAPLSLSWRY